MGEGGVFGAADDVVGVIAFAFEEHVGFANGEGFGVDFLAVEVGDDLFVALVGEAFEGFFGDGEHATGTAGAVV